MTAHVRHSQRMSASYVAAEKSGTIICNHCACMAGSGEIYSNIAALVFILEVNTKSLHFSIALTIISCASVEYVPASSINFSIPSKKRKTMHENINDVSIGMYISASNSSISN